MIGWVLVRYGLIAAPIALVVGLVRGDWQLVLGAVIWGVISFGWLFARMAKRGAQKPGPTDQAPPSQT